MSLPHIITVHWTEAYHLADVVTQRYARPSALALSPVPWRRLPILGLAKLSATEEEKDGTRTHTTTLTATLCLTAFEPTRPLRPMAYKLTAADGTEWLLGTCEPPFPLTTFATTLGAKPGGEHYVQLEARLTGPLPLLRYRTY